MKYLLSFILPISLLFFPQRQVAQQNLFSEEKEKLFQEFNKLYQEVVHVHFNKSIYTKGEALGLTAYVVDRKTNTPSSAAKNLYCTISNEDGTVLKKQLLKVENGYVSTIFPIDSVFAQGRYVLKAYTNWMLNFTQQNYFMDSFYVLDASITKGEKSHTENKFDVQALPEGGHFINDVETKVGVIIKDHNNMGVPKLKGFVEDAKGTIISSFELNDFGIARFNFTPKKDKSYFISFKENGGQRKYKIAHSIEEKGIALQLTQLRESVLVTLSTNSKTLEKISENDYYITIYDGNALKKIPIRFSDKRTVSTKISFSNLSKGMNVFTLFSAEGKPLSERLFFNYQGIEILKSRIESTQKIGKDSTQIDLYYPSYKKSVFNNLSVSILPYDTKSYHKNKNIISQALLQPFLKGFIENSSYYFNIVTPKVINDLDNLLLTQGWSSYDWNSIFESPLEKSYAFEKGISFTIQLDKNKRGKSLLFRYSDGSVANIIDLENDITSFNSIHHYPETNTEFFLSNMSRKGRLGPVDATINFFPEKIPNLNVDAKDLPKTNLDFSSKIPLDGGIYNSLNDVQQLNPIEVEVKLEEQRRNSIETKNFGETYFFDEKNGFKFNNLFGFFRAKGFFVDRAPGTNEVILLNLQPSTTLKGENIVTVFLDDFPLLNLNQLEFFPYQTIDYININKNGFGEGIRGAGGVIRIYTDPYKMKKFGKQTFSVFRFPLSFTSNKKFYTPAYQNYDSVFFKNYGAISWKPINAIEEDGLFRFSFNSLQQKSVLVCIEGITSDGQFILEKKVIHLE